jgi:hypothetical protein
MKTTVKIVNNVNETRKRARKDFGNSLWNRKDETILKTCIKEAQKESRTLISAFRECAYLTNRSLKSVSARFYNFIKDDMIDSGEIKPFSRKYVPSYVAKNTLKVKKVKEETNVTNTVIIDLHYATTKELFNKLSLEKKLRLISECIACSL